jgi:hypothetical protein
MKDAEYFAHPAVGSTSIKAMATGTPRGYWAKHVDPARLPFVPTEAMRQGSLVDCLITCPDEFDEKYVLAPLDAPKRPTSTQLNAKKPSEATIEAIQFWYDFDAEVGVREVISHDWFTNAVRITEVLAKDSAIGPILRLERQSQVPHFWIDEDHEIQCKYKPDLEPEDGSLIDLKKGASASPRWFSKQAYQLAYDIQLDHYGKGFTDLHGVPPSRAGFIVYEWKWPHECALIIADDDYIAMGHDRRNDALDLIVKCQRENNWPSHGESVITPPTYANIAAADNDTDLDDLGLEGLE